MATRFAEIVKLRDVEEAQDRGYAFEQLIREILPYEDDPPRAEHGVSEQFDAVFRWDNWTFLVEAKAKARPILRGSPDWRSFTDKVRDRHGRAIGIFCSLNDVHEDLYASARDLNRAGTTVLIMAGPLWDALAKTPLPMDRLLGYLVHDALMRPSDKPPNITKIKKWIYEQPKSETYLRRLCQERSRRFVDGNGLPNHDRLYVPREIDSEVKEALLTLKPSKLRVRRTRRAPAQILVVRDTSGAGKTMLSVELAGATDFVGVASAAIDPNLDSLIGPLQDAELLDRLRRLQAIDKPLAVIVDSLEEATGTPEKQAEMTQLIKEIARRNQWAKDHRLLLFPMGVIFTLRDEYWDDWAGVFNGWSVESFTRRMSQFTARELDIALTNYEGFYGFSLARPLSPRAKEILSVPFYLQVFAEANMGAGEVAEARILAEDVLHQFFDRKRKDVRRHDVPGFHRDNVMPLLARLALAVVEEATHDLGWRTILGLVSSALPVLQGSEKRVVAALVSDQILKWSEGESKGSLRFRHTRFVEYLLAYHILLEIQGIALQGKRRELVEVEELTSASIASPLVSAFRVHDAVHYLCATREFPGLEDFVKKYYARSLPYMSNTLRRLRVNLRKGVKAEPDDIRLILLAAGSTSPEIAWESFWVLSAKLNDLPSEWIIDSFRSAWDKNAMDQRARERWKLVAKMAERGLLMNEFVVRAVLKSSSVRDWEVLLGSVLERGLQEDFNQIWSHTETPSALMSDAPDWQHVQTLLRLALNKDIDLTNFDYASMGRSMADGDGGGSNVKGHQG